MAAPFARHCFIAAVQTLGHSRCLANRLTSFVDCVVQRHSAQTFRHRLHTSCYLLQHVVNDVDENAEDIQCPKPNSATDALKNLTPDDAKRLKILKLEYDMLDSSGVLVPSTMQDEDWLHLLEKCPSVSSRKRYFTYLFKREKATENKRAKAAINKQIRDEKMAGLENLKQEGNYTFKNTFMLFTQEQTMLRSYMNNLAYSMMNGPNLVFDLGFGDTMTGEELKSLMRQLQVCHSMNKVEREPYHFHFCNVKPKSEIAQTLQQGLPNIHELPYSVTHQNYLECYPKEKLVYLTPNSRNVLQKFDYNDVYIVGGIVDKANEEPLTFAKAKKESIRTAKFPLDHHVKWVMGSKSLTLNQVTQILIELKRNNDWRQALLKSLPRRKYNDV